MQGIVDPSTFLWCGFGFDPADQTLVFFWKIACIILKLYEKLKCNDKINAGE